jgi:hypothetical protein
MPLFCAVSEASILLARMERHHAQPLEHLARKQPSQNISGAESCSNALPFKLLEGPGYSGDMDAKIGFGLCC